MEDFSERRKYRRCDNVVCETTIKVDGDKWLIVDLCDFSAAGLRFLSDHVFYLEEKLMINLVVYNMLSEFKIKVAGIIIRIDHEHGKPMYVVKFDDIDKQSQTILDELVRTGLSLKNYNEMLDQEQYSHLLLPRFGAKHNKTKR